MKLREYILKHYNGRNVDFAEDNGIKPQQVGLMIKKGNYYVYDSKLMIARREVK